MKKLILIRHGKSSWDLNVRDYDRVLQQRGVEDGHLIGKALLKTSLKPDLIMSSPAARALQTATIVTEYLDYNLSSLKLNRSLYTFDSNELAVAIKEVTNEVDTLLVFSHNHGLTEFANQYGSTRFDNVPTTGVVVIDFDIPKWSDLTSGTTAFHLFPKQIR
ncbi:SixA phosphatase family protein [Nonlabens ponticola]|uniref:Histidine phosphatase family protein n=1 Tax=Nonlabens ponticola TaxID=2496866 RepID=A0A3S9MZX7_9FLAO|nr:histidine phosphatase family protein [Nonlabens ponticola]AZQ44632.1 histidine phosphatase family protein [Nonlabens ponticola]